MDWLRYTQELAQIFAILALLSRGLGRPYSALLWYLTVSTVRDTIFLELDIHSTAYALAWAWTEPVIIALQITMSLAAVFGVIRHYPGIGGFGRSLIAASVALGICAGGIAAAIQPGVYVCVPNWLPVLLGVWKWAGWLCFGVVLSAFLFNRILPTTLRPNLLLHLKLVAAFVGCGPAVTAFSLNMPLAIANAAVAFGATVEIGCCVAWAVWMTPEGEVLPQHKPPSEEDSERVRAAYDLAMKSHKMGSTWRVITGRPQL